MQKKYWRHKAVNISYSKWQMVQQNCQEETTNSVNPLTGGNNVSDWRSQWRTSRRIKRQRWSPERLLVSPRWLRLSSSHWTSSSTVRAGRRIIPNCSERQWRDQDSAHESGCIAGKSINDYWSVDMHRDLSDSWKGFTYCGPWESWKFRWMLRFFARREQRSTWCSRSDESNKYSKDKARVHRGRSWINEKTLESSKPKDHEDQIAVKGCNSMTHYNLVHKFIPLLQAMKILDAKSSSGPEMEETWDDSSLAVRERQTQGGYSGSTKRQRRKSTLLHWWTSVISNMRS